jgi:hypothetical protein
MSTLEDARAFDVDSSFLEKEKGNDVKNCGD